MLSFVPPCGLYTRGNSDSGLAATLAYTSERSSEVGVVGGMLGGTFEYCSGAWGATGRGLTFAPMSPVTRVGRRLGS